MNDKVPSGSDLYLFALTGAARIANAGSAQDLPQDAFATLAEGTEFALSNPGATTVELIGVVAPPAGSGGALAGYKGAVSVVARSAAPLTDLPAEKKRRIYFVDRAAVHSERAHAMIVEYQADTVTSMHQHPNADSMFVPLTGKVRFTFDGAEHVLGRGGATVFPAGNLHGLCVAEGKVSFLEFHIPAAYTTLR
jgi:quercetin dioxygenase-like cupin family protein